MKFLFLVCSVYVVVHVSRAQQTCRPFETAWDNLREVIIGACETYQQNINQAVFCSEGFRNCTEIWEAFIGSFRHQPRCNVSDERLELYINLTRHSLPAGKSMFWENVYPFVHRFTNLGQRYTALSDTFTGYIGNGPQWCSTDHPNSLTGMSEPGEACPGWEATPTCPQSAQRAFWVAASKNFARSALGEIFVMLNATFQPIFANGTYFAVHELPYLREGIVTKATVLLLNENPVTDTSRDMCEDESLQVLANLMAAKNIQYQCKENRRDLVTLFCQDYPYSRPLCSTDKTSRAERTLVYSTFMYILVLALIMTHSDIHVQ